MRTIAIVEDEKLAASKLQQYIKRYSDEQNEVYKITWFNNPNIFLQNYEPIYDLIFMDIMMPDANGLDISKKIRKMDNHVIIVFVTNMAKFAIRGYEVNAFDFIVKPLIYSDFKVKFERITQLWSKKSENKIVIRTNNSTVLLVESDIKFIEIYNHKLIYHTVYGNVYSHGTLIKALEELTPNRFIKCNKCYIVNLDFCKSIIDGMIIIGNDQIPIATKKKKIFSDIVNEYYRGK